MCPLYEVFTLSAFCRGLYAVSMLGVLMLRVVGVTE